MHVTCVDCNLCTYQRLARGSTPRTPPDIQRDLVDFGLKFRPGGKGVNIFLSKAVITHGLYPGALVIYVSGYPSQLLLKLKLLQWLSPRVGCLIHIFRRNPAVLFFKVWDISRRKRKACSHADTFGDFVKQGEYFLTSVPSEICRCTTAVCHRGRGLKPFWSRNVARDPRA